MNNEIKEILDRLDYEEWEVALYKVPITWCELYDIRDYITNLQKENEKMSTRFRNCKKIKEDYKSRLEKAIEYMNNYIEVEDALINERIKIEFKEVLNILQNGSENDE